MVSKRVVLGLAVGLVAASLVVSACSSGGASGNTTLNVELTDFAFKPNAFTVPSGKEISVNVSNKGANTHEFVIMKAGTQVSPPFDENDEGNIYWEIDNVEAGTSKSDKFTAPAPGTYQIACGVAGHVEQGMVGTLTVTP